MTKYSGFPIAVLLDGTEIMGPLQQNNLDVNITISTLKTFFVSTEVTRLTALVAALPTVLPITRGVLWLNGGVVCLS